VEGLPFGPDLIDQLLAHAVEVLAGRAEGVEEPVEFLKLLPSERLLADPALRLVDPHIRGGARAVLAGAVLLRHGNVLLSEFIGGISRVDLSGRAFDCLAMI